MFQQKSLRFPGGFVMKTENFQTNPELHGKLAPIYQMLQKLMYSYEVDPATGAEDPNKLDIY